MNAFAKALALFCFLFSGAAVFAAESPTLKALIVIMDDYENPDLNAISAGVKMDYGLVSQFLDVLERSGVVKVEKTLISGRTATKENIMRLVKNMVLTDKDVFFFYFSGHGGMEKGKTFLYTAEEAALLRDDLEAAVKTRPARLKMIFTDACSSSIEAMAPRGRIGGPGQGDKDNPFVEIYRNLFLQYKGLLHVSAASEGEFAWSGDTGGLFTKSLISEILVQNPKLTWEEIIKESRVKVGEKYNLMVNAGLLDRSVMDEMDQKGIKGQNPKAYSFPTVVEAASSGTAAVSTASQTSQTTIAPAAAPGQVVIQNLLNKEMTFTVTENPGQRDRAQVHKIAAKAAKTLPVKNILYFFLGDKPRGDYWELESGSFVINSNYLGDPELYFDEPSARAGAANPLVGAWLWEEYDPVKNTVYTMNIRIAEDGTFEWVKGGEKPFKLTGTWTASGSGGSATITLKYSFERKGMTEVYKTADYGKPNMTLIAKENSKIKVLLTLK